VTFTNSLSVAEHVHVVITSLRARKLCTLSESCVLTAWTTSRCRQFTDLSSSLASKLTYASSAWWGFASTSDLEAFIRPSDRCGFVPANLPTFADLCENADEKLFNAITSDCNHVLHYLLPSQSQGSQHYDLRQRHSTQLRAPLANWSSHWQELHSTHAVLELALAV